MDLLRFADKHIGRPLCLFLTACRYICYPFWRNRKLPVPKKILIIKLSEMGSTVLANPAMEEIRKRIPDADVYILVLENNRAIIDIMRLTRVDNVVSVDAGSVGALFKTGWHAYRRFRRAGIDTTIDMVFFSRFSAVFAFLLCRGNRVGFHGFKNEGVSRGKLLTHEVLYSPHVHTSVAFMALVKTLFRGEHDKPSCRENIDQNEFRVPTYESSKGDIESVRAKLKAAGIEQGRKGVRIVLVNPNSSGLFPLRRWPLNNFIRAASRLLSKREDVYIVVTGADSDVKDAEAIVDGVRFPRCASFAGKTTLPELLALYSMSSLMITNDSGPAHFSVLTRMPVIVLFGPETPVLYSPMGKTARCLYSGFACSPCVSAFNAKASPCKRSLCLEAITVDEVLAQAENVLDGGSFEKRL